LNAIIKWLNKQLIKVVSDMLMMFNLASADAFDLIYIKAILMLAQWLLWFLIVITLGVGVMNFFIKKSEGKNESPITLLKKLLTSLIVGVIGFDLAKMAFGFGYHLTNLIVGLINIISTAEARSAFSWENLIDNLGMPGINILTTLIIFVGLIFVMVKVLFQVTKRFGVYFASMLTLVFYLPSYLAGSDDALITWLKQLISILGTHIIQTTMLFLGLVIMSDNLVVGIGILFASSHVEKIMGKFGWDTSSAGGRALQMATTGGQLSYYISMMRKGG